jgi:hypothetical protein
MDWPRATKMVRTLVLLFVQHLPVFVLRRCGGASWGWLLALCCFLPGCAAPPPPPEPEPIVYSAEQRYAAAEYALQQNIRLQAIVDVCSGIDEKTRALAELTQTQWWDRNWPLVAVADAEFETEMRENQRRLGEITGQLYALKFDLEARQQSNDTIRGNVRRSTQRDRTCGYYLGLYQKGQLDLSVDMDHFPVLEQMAADYPRTANSKPRRVPHVAYGFVAKVNAGRSLVGLERFVRREYCTGAKIINIFDQWPRELYGVFCPEVLPITIECDWGKCAELIER